MAILKDLQSKGQSTRGPKSRHSQQPETARPQPQLVPKELLIAGKHIIGTHADEYLTPQDFEDILRRPRQGPEFEPMLINEALATYILGNYANPDNRHTKRPSMKKFGDDMKADAWELTHQGLAFDSTPKLTDGHNRLEACVRSGSAFPTLVWFGWPPKAITSIDIGVARSTEDVLRIGGTPMGRDVIKGIRLIHAIEDARSADENGRIDEVRNLVRAGAQISPAEIQHWVDQHPEIHSVVEWVSQTSPKVGVAVRSGLIAGLYMIAREKHKDENRVLSFHQKLILGTGMKDTLDPVYRLKQRVSMGESSGMLLAAEIVKTWNAYAEGRTVKHLAWRKDEPFPYVEA